MSNLSDALCGNLDDLGKHNLNNLIKILKTRLNDLSKDSDIFTIDQYVAFLATALEAVNVYPPFTNYGFSDTSFIESFSSLIVQYATYLAATSKSLIERGREFETSDNGVTFIPPTMSDLLMHLGDSEFNRWNETIRACKPNCLSDYFGKLK